MRLVNLMIRLVRYNNNYRITIGNRGIHHCVTEVNNNNLGHKKGARGVRLVDVANTPQAEQYGVTTYSRRVRPKG